MSCRLLKRAHDASARRTTETRGYAVMLALILLSPNEGGICV